MKVQDAVNIDDLRRLAKRRLPRSAFDFIEGGVEDEHCLLANESSFAGHRLVPRYMVDTSRRDQSVELFGHSYASPFGIAPTGMAALFAPNADLIPRALGCGGEYPVHNVGRFHRVDRGGGTGRTRAYLVSTVRGARQKDF